MTTLDRRHMGDPPPRLHHWWSRGACLWCGTSWTPEARTAACDRGRW
jgi:hypothetical protein